MRQFFLILLIGLLPAGVVYSQPGEPLDLPECEIARAPSTYTSEVIKIPDDVKKNIQEYKKSWIDLCDRKAGSSVYNTFALAKILEDEFTYADLPAKGTRMERAIELDRVLAHDLMQFIPAFQGSYMEYEFFMPRFEIFSQVSIHGTEEDKQFFQLHADLNGNSILPNWYQQTWDYGGCFRFGEFDWVEAFQKLKQAKRIKSVEYRKVIDSIESNLGKTFDRLYFKAQRRKSSKICTCNEKQAVQTDLKKLIKYLRENKQHSKLAAKLKVILLSVKKGEVPVLSQAEQHCSGG